MKGFLEYDLDEVYERLRHAIGMPDYDSLPTTPYQPVTDDHALQVAPPLNLGDEHQGESNNNAHLEREDDTKQDDGGGEEGHAQDGTEVVGNGKGTEGEERRHGDDNANGVSVHHPDPLPQSSGLPDEEIAGDNANVPQNPSQRLPLTSPKPDGRPSSLPTTVPSAAPASRLPQPPVSSLSPPPTLTAPHTDLVRPQVGSSPEAPHCPPTTSANPQLTTAPDASLISRIEEPPTPTVKGEANPTSGKPLGVHRPRMKDKTMKHTAQMVCNTVSQQMSEATGAKPVCTRNGQRIRVVNMSRPMVSKTLQPRLPPYPTSRPSDAQPTPVLLQLSQQLQHLHQDLHVSSEQPRSSADRVQLRRLLDAFKNLPPRSLNGQGMIWAMVPGMHPNHVSASTNSPSTATVSTNVMMHANRCPESDQASHARSGAQAVAPTPQAPPPIARNSVKRKFESTVEESQEKKRVRAMRNRQSAEKSRRRRKEYVVKLESNVEGMREQSKQWRDAFLYKYRAQRAKHLARAPELLNCFHILTGLKRLSEMQHGVIVLYGDNHGIRTPVMSEVVDDVTGMVRR